MEQNTPDRGTGTLYLVATPIGNLDDISYRALKILKEVDLIAAEDTRRTRKLLSFFDIHTPLLSFREHNKVYQGERLAEMLKEGKNIALCSDAGMPVISDPGEDFVGLCIERGIHVTVIPGANAALSSLVLSGFSANSFLYLGFIPRKKGKRMEFISGIADEPHTMIFYESPNRVVELLKSLREGLGERKVCVVRELTKIYEETLRGTLTEVIETLDKRGELKGEFCVVMEGKNPEPTGGKQYLDTSGVIEEIENLLSEGMEKQQAFKKIANRYQTSKRAIYQLYIQYGESKKNPR